MYNDDDYMFPDNEEFFLNWDINDKMESEVKSKIY
jgi:hypothetical protein